VLGIGVADGNVRVDGRLRQVLVVPDPKGQLILRLERLDADNDLTVCRVVDRVEEGVPRQSRRVAQARGPEQRQDDVKSVTEAVFPEGLPKILFPRSVFLGMRASFQKRSSAFPPLYPGREIVWRSRVSLPRCERRMIRGEPDPPELRCHRG